MGINVVVSQEANNDVAEITSYIANNLKAPKAAIKLEKEIIKIIELISVTPEAYPKVSKKIFPTETIRFGRAKNFNIFYTYSKKKKLVNIIRVIYTKSNKLP